MMRTVELISPGDVGQAVGALLVEGSVRVVTCVVGRASEKVPTK